MQPKLYDLVQGLQPQYAAFLAASGPARSVIPAPGDIVLTVDLGGSLEAECLLDKLFKDDALSALNSLSIERQGSIFEFYSSHLDDLDLVAKRLKGLGGVKDPAKTVIAKPAEVSAVELIESVSAKHAGLINRSRKGVMLAAGESLLMLEIQPVNKVGQFFNQLERSFPEIQLVDLEARSGLIRLTGTLPLMKDLKQHLGH